MPNSILEDPGAPALPGPTPISAPQIRHAYLKDHITPVTILPIIPGATVIPPSLISFLAVEFNAEIMDGNTYPMDSIMTVNQFSQYWFGGFVAVALRGKWEAMPVEGEVDFAAETCGTFYIKPNYPGRCCHVANGGFLTCREKRGTGVGRLMGEAYIEWAANLGYNYSVFNLVFETNITSIRIWESLGFKRLGKVKGAGRLRSHPNPVDAIIFGRDLSSDTDFVSDQRFERIRYYLEKGTYPPNSDRSEKSRLRSASTHYKLVDGKLMLNNKEVVSDGHLQYEIAKREHEKVHGGINKTTSIISEKYHWVRIKETVSQVIRNCAECRENNKTPPIKPENLDNSLTSRPTSSDPSPPERKVDDAFSEDTEMKEAISPQIISRRNSRSASAELVAKLHALTSAAESGMPSNSHHPQLHQQHYQPQLHYPVLQSNAVSTSHPDLHTTHPQADLQLGEIPIDPRMINVTDMSGFHQAQYGNMSVHTESAQTIVAAARAAEDLTDRLSLVGQLSALDAERFAGDYDVGMEEGMGGGG